MRESKFRGCGIFMLLQPIKDLQEGDTCWDADLGALIWRNDKWESNNQKYADLYDRINKN